MPTTVKPPKAYNEFIAQFPKLDQAWRAINEAGTVGPLDERGQRLVKLGIAMGAMREGAIRSGVRKAAAMGIEPEAIVQLVALCAGTLGMPSTVAVHTWVTGELDKTRR